MVNYLTEYLRQFETLVVVPGISQGLIGGVRRVSLRPGRLSKTPFGSLLRGRLQSPEPCGVDYYGLLRLSSGVDTVVEEARRDYPNHQVRMVEVPVVYFNSIRLETVLHLSPDLAQYFPEFKKRLLDLRGFNHSYRGR